jgi:membrane protein YqaA with SNARE-associated domain
VGELLGLLGVSFASALIPLINLEVYLVGLSAVSDPGRVWLLATVAGIGQMVGKLVWYYLGANALRWGWIRRKVETPKAQAKLELWRGRTHNRPVISSMLVFASAFSGFPPFAIVAVLAGQLRMSLAIFMAMGVAGRILRFATFLSGGAWVTHLVTGWF